METVTKKTATNLTTESVSILTQEVYYTTEKQVHFETKTETKTEIRLEERDGEMVEVEVPIEVEVQVPVEVDVEVEHQVGSNHRRAYTNSASGREMLAEGEPEEIVAEVMDVWGDEPTIEEPTFDEDYTPEPTLEERVSSIEETLVNGGGNTGMDVWDEMAVAIEEGVNEV